MKEKQDDRPQQELSEEIINLHNKELKVMIIKMVNELGRRMTSSMNLGVNHSEKFNKELENIVKNQTEPILL